MKLSLRFGKNSDFSAEYKRFKKGIAHNPGDYGLKVQFIKSCLLNRFTNQETIGNHITEVLALFETIENAASFDLQCHYLVGKYYQENKDYRKAYQIYLNTIKRFNQYVDKHPELKSENSELAYSVALNLMILQASPVDPEVEKCFKNIRKSYPLHLKRLELENEMAKPAPHKEHIKQLKEEIRQLKAEEEKETSALVKTKSTKAPVEYEQIKKDMEHNPDDYEIKAQFIKSCLLNRFSNQETAGDQIAKALAFFETIENEEAFDLECYSVVGKYYEENKDHRKAYRIYLNAIKRFNESVVKNPNLKSENSDSAYSVALNLMILQSDPIDPEVEKCFKNIGKSYPLHIKRLEFENEMAKPGPDQERIKQLKEEIRRLKAEEEKESSPSTKGKSVDTPVSSPQEKDDALIRLFRVPSPSIEDLALKDSQKSPITSVKDDFFHLSPISEFPDHGVSFMVFQNNDWEGPLTLSQLRSNGHLNPNTWVCRVGSQVVIQAYEVPDLHSLIQ